MAGKTQSAGSLSADISQYSIAIKQAAPGVFFALFGAVIISISVLKEITYKSNPTPNEAQATVVEQLIPDTPPFGDN